MNRGTGHPLGLVILGRQGSGKGTQAGHLADRYGVVHISTGDMLRAAVSEGTELGLKAKAVMDAGDLVGDDIMNGIVAERLTKHDVVTNGYLLDGYPRTAAQAEAFEAVAGASFTLAINLDVPVEEVTARMLSRGREDDTTEAIERRLELYEADTAPLLARFEADDRLVVVDGLGTEAEVLARLIAAISTATA